MTLILKVTLMMIVRSRLLGATKVPEAKAALAGVGGQAATETATMIGVKVTL